MFEFVSNVDFWRAFMAIWLQVIIFELILKEQERIRLEPYMLKIEAEVKSYVKELDLADIKEQIEEHNTKINKLKELMEELTRG